MTFILYVVFFPLSCNPSLVAVDNENDGASLDSKAGKEIIDFKEVKRIDHILANLQRKVTLKSKIISHVHS